MLLIIKIAKPILCHSPQCYHFLFQSRKVFFISPINQVYNGPLRDQRPYILKSKTEKVSISKQNLPRHETLKGLVIFSIR